MSQAPSDWAKQLDPGDGDGTGVRFDELMDALLDARDFAWKMQNISVQADEILDDRGLLPGSVREDVNDIRVTAGEVHNWLEAFADELDELSDEAREAM